MPTHYINYDIAIIAIGENALYFINQLKHRANIWPIADTSFHRSLIVHAACHCQRKISIISMKRWRAKMSVDII